MTRDDVVDLYGDDLMFMDPSYFDKAIIGVVTQFNNTVVCYDKKKVIDILIKHDGMDEDEALEYFDFNISGAWIGEMTPGFLETL
jgi:hypothetical protein